MYTTLLIITLKTVVYCECHVLLCHFGCFTESYPFKDRYSTYFISSHLISSYIKKYMSNRDMAKKLNSSRGKEVAVVVEIKNHIIGMW